jgi:hypothetical protein
LLKENNGSAACPDNSARSSIGELSLGAARLFVAAKVIIRNAQSMTTVNEDIESIHVLGQILVRCQTLTVVHERVMVGLQLLELEIRCDETAQAH